MAGWEDIGRLGATVRPLTEPLPKPGNRYSQFSASTASTVRLLARELGMLDAKLIVVELALRERDIRLDGMPRSDAVPSSPAITISFESKFGPLRYSTCEFTKWNDNLRAIALAMEALRAVDRYGVSKRGEQYVGWRALPRGSDDTYGIEDVRAARYYLDDVYGGDMKRALMETHPDRGGDREEFGKVMRIKGLLS